MPQTPRTNEDVRLSEDERRERNWKRWGPYLSERQWGTVREDYSEHGSCWDYLSHDHARSRAYRWGEDGLLGFTDRECRLNFAVALWNGRDSILKERLFGLTGPEGNHGEDVKECYYYLDATPTHSYMKGLYKYPHAAFPYERLVEENRRRGKDAPEFELLDTGAFDDDRYFDVGVEYAKESPDDLLIQITITNRGPESEELRVLPTLWFRNTWSWGRTGEGHWPRPSLRRVGPGEIEAMHATLGRFRLSVEPGPDGLAPELLFTENETNAQRLFGASNASPYAKDAFHDYVVQGKSSAVNPECEGTKAAAHFRLCIEGHDTVVLRLRLTVWSEVSMPRFGQAFAQTIAMRRADTDAFYDARFPATMRPEAKQVARQAYAGLLWSKQFYHYVVEHWLEGDPSHPAPPDTRKRGRNAEWAHLYNRDIISMPDKWEYPWYAAWDLAFHMIPMAKVDPQFAKEQILLLLREWYMHPNGQIPAYEFAFGDVNPPVHAWAAWRVYKMTGVRGARDREFLARAFQKLVINFTWWVNRKDVDGRHIFAGGFLGLDNIGVFDRSKPLPTGGHLEQADGTAWMAFYCSTMLAIAIELASEDPTYEDVASKFFEHFVAITDAMNRVGGEGLWNEEDGFYYDQLHHDGTHIPLRVRSMVGLIPLIAVEIVDETLLDRLPGFRKRLDWFLENRPMLARHLDRRGKRNGQLLLSIPSRERLERVLQYLFDEKEFLSDFGVRSVSKRHEEHPYTFDVMGEQHRVDYVPGESTSGLFGGNSNWRGPIWFPVNYLLIEALERYHHFFGDELKVECPVGSGIFLDLSRVADELKRRLASIFLPDASGHRPVHGEERRYAADPSWRDLTLFYEYFHGDSGRGVGASHQTGWTALVTRCLEDLALLDDSELTTERDAELELVAP